MKPNDPSLFSQRNREGFDFASHAESSIHYLDRSARSEAQRIRNVFDRWYLNYPKNSRGELRGRFRSRNEDKHLAAVFELAIHELLISKGFSVEVHPTLTGCDRHHPDFLVRGTSGVEFVVEAVVATGSDSQEKAKGRTLKVIYDEINKLKSKDFYISVLVEGYASSQPSGRKIRSFLEEKLQRVDVGEIIAGGHDKRPIWLYKHEGFTFEFSPIPKGPSRRGLDDDLIGAISGEVGWVAESVDSLLKPLEKKANGFSDIGLPFIIAVNALDDGIRRNGFELAVFGCERSAPSYRRDALWCRGEEATPIRTRVSAVLAFSQFTPWSAAISDMILYVNPWAALPLPTTISDVPTSTLGNDGLIQYTAGPSLGEQLGLWVGWPSQERPHN